MDCCLSPDSTKPLPESIMSMLTYHNRCFVAFTWEETLIRNKFLETTLFKLPYFPNVNNMNKFNVNWEHVFFFHLYHINVIKWLPVLIFHQTNSAHKGLNVMLSFWVNPVVESQASDWSRFHLGMLSHQCCIRFLFNHHHIIIIIIIIVA